VDSDSSPVVLDSDPKDSDSNFGDSTTSLALVIFFVDHPQSSVVYDFGRICLSDDNFRKP